ncbi:MAG TPA: protein kinase [Thermoanaerobaculia bacterium]|nr:protein kinase [Thermoanaerobaculia bacterium]
MTGRARSPRIPEERRQSAERVFLDALERPCRERPAFVRAECGADDELRSLVFSLLLAEERTGPFDRIADDLGALCAEIVTMSQGAEGTVGERPPARIEAGDSVGRYEVRELLGVGGMGEVYRGFDPRLQRDVAIKVIARRIGAGADVIERFEGEARAASSLNHPNIVTVHDFGEHAGRPFLVMELVEGKSLRELLGEPLPVGRLVELGAQIADGLAAAHANGVVHRDLKPENILIDGQGRARILDFGLARFGPTGESAAETVAFGEPAAGGETLVGTVGYMAPEAIRGRRTDARADQFALGAILYEMATGARAFQRGSMPETLIATIADEPSAVLDLNPGVPTALASIVERCLSKDPRRRFANSAALCEALRAIPEHEDTPFAGRFSVPDPPTRLIGRDRELRQVTELLRQKHVRMVTLTGPGGSGKTRLAIEAAHSMREELSGGVVFVSLAAVHDPQLVVPSISRELIGSECTLEGLVHGARETSTDGDLLLVLDNFEQVVEAAPALGELVTACPRLVLLVTSRALLHLSCEHELPLRPLELPPPEEPLPPDELAAVPAVAFFLERARLAVPDFELDEDNAAAVTELCRRVDGLPLALELAAPRLRTMAPQAILERLESRMSILTRGSRDLPDRQRTLRGALEWSYGLLDEGERRVLRRLAIFVGGFTLEAAEAVCDPFARLRPGVLEAVESLLDQSLVTRIGVFDGEPRFGMLETVREHALERMREEEDQGALARAHAAFFLVLAEEAGQAFPKEASSRWREVVARERGNLDAALAWARAADEGEWGLRMATSLFPFWELGEGLAHGQRHLAALVELPSVQQPSALRGRALFSTAVLSRLSSPQSGSDLAYFQRSLEVYREIGEPAGQAAALNAIGIRLTDHEDFPGARACLEECLELWRGIGENLGRAQALSNLAHVLRVQGDPEHSVRLYREAEDAFRRLGDEVSAAWQLSHLADIAREQGDPGARQLLDRALTAFRELDQEWGVATVLSDLAELARDRDPEEAAKDYREALAIFKRLGHLRGVAHVLEGMARLALTSNEDERGQILAGAASVLRRRVGATRESGIRRELAEALERSRRRLGAEAADRLFRRGEATPLDRLLTEQRLRAQA